MPRFSQARLPAMRHDVRGRGKPEVLFRRLSHVGSTADIPRLRALREALRSGRAFGDYVLLTSMRLCTSCLETEEAKTETHRCGDEGAKYGRLPYPDWQISATRCLPAMRRYNSTDPGRPQRLSEATTGAMALHPLPLCVGQSRAKGWHHSSITWPAHADAA